MYVYKTESTLEMDVLIFCIKKEKNELVSIGGVTIRGCLKCSFLFAYVNVLLTIVNFHCSLIKNKVIKYNIMTSQHGSPM